MNNIWSLIKIQLLSYFDINKAIHSTNKKEKRKYIVFLLLVFVILLILCASSFAYSISMSGTFAVLHKMSLLPAIMMYAACLLTLFTTCYKVNGVLFAYKDYDIIMSLPVKTGSIIASRLIMLYLMNFVFTILLVVPSMIVYGIKVLPSPVFYFLAGIALFFIPLIPIIIATFLGSMIALISSRFKHSNLLGTLLSFTFIIGLLLISGSMGSAVSGSNLAAIGNELENLILKSYPPAIWYADGICNYNLMLVLLFLFVSIVPFVIYLIIIVKYYNKINTALITHKTNNHFVLSELKQHGTLRALYQKELRRYFSSTIYVLNTAIGVVLLLILSLLLCFVPLEQLEQLMELPGFAGIIRTLTPLAVSFMIVMSATTPSSISTEGKSLWILKSIPVNIKDIYFSKVLVSLTISIPAVIINAVLMTFSLKLNLLQSLLLFLTPTAYAVFSAFLGLVINLKFPFLDWLNETAAVKQSASVLINMLAGFACSAIPLIFAILLPDCQIIISILTPIILILLTYLLFSSLMKQGYKQLQSLGE